MGTTRAKYTLEFKLEAVRLAKSGQSIAATAKILGLAEQTLHNWIKAEQQGRLGGTGHRSHWPVSLSCEVLGVSPSGPVGLVEGRSVARHEVRDTALGDGRDRRLADLLQSSTLALHAGLCQPDAVRTGMACRPAKAGRVKSRLREPGNEGKVKAAGTGGAAGAGCSGSGGWRSGCRRRRRDPRRRAARAGAGAAHRLGAAAQARVRHRPAALPELRRRGAEDHRGDPGAGGDREDPHPPGVGPPAAAPGTGERGGARGPLVRRRLRSVRHPGRTPAAFTPGCIRKGAFASCPPAHGACCPCGQPCEGV
jgi:transposase-like protein